MNGCEGFEIAIEMRLHGAADQDASGRLDAHLATCEACRQFENEVKTSEKTMRERARPLESSFDDARLRAKIRRAQRNPWITPLLVAAGFFSFIAIAALIAAGTYALALNRRSWPLWLLAFLLTLITLWVAYFFRDPERTGERGEQVVIAPADGKVVLIENVDEPAFMGGRAHRVSIFMNVFNVHVNRYPVSGVVRYVKYNPGKFLNAAAEKSSTENEQMSVGIETAHGRILTRQIAGLIARRIVTYSKVGETVQQGDRMGLIRFGSRVDVFLPMSATDKVKIGDITVAGTTVIGELAKP